VHATKKYTAQLKRTGAAKIKKNEDVKALSVQKGPKTQALLVTCWTSKCRLSCEAAILASL
jgi:hypothetical protein